MTKDSGQLSGFVDFDPDKDIPSLQGKVIFITGGTAGLGAESLRALARHSPAHIYFTGRNASAATAITAAVRQAHGDGIGLTFVELDMSSLASVKAAVGQTFRHDRLDLLMCNAGVMAVPPALSKDGFEIQFAINHLAHAMILHLLLPTLLHTATMPGADVRVVVLTSTGWKGHPRGGIAFDKLGKPGDGLWGYWTNYGQSKLANVLFASELARRHPSLRSVSVHPGVVETGLVTALPAWRRRFVTGTNRLMGKALLPPAQGSYSQLWCAAGAPSADLVNGAYYMPIGVMSNASLDAAASSEALARELWAWTEGVLANF